MSSVHADPPPPIVTEPSGINYATGPALGKGGFAICHRAERYEGSKPTGQIVALKIVKTKMEPAKLAQKFVSELQIHSKLSHPNIVAFYRAFAFHTSTYVVLELCPNGSLADMLKKRKYLTLPEIRRFVIQICGAVKYLHHRHIVHRDLKTGNLFLDHNMNVKVGDFGLAALLVTEKEMEVKRRTTMCGTPNYLAPEILEKGKGHDEKVDLWAIGVIAYTLAVGKAPFHAGTKEEIYKRLRSVTYTWPELSATTNQSSDLRNLVSALLVEEELRPIPDHIVSQPFFKIAFVPPSIPTTAREKPPKWPEMAIPSPDAIRRGYSDTWYALCKESGVGEYEAGRCFKLNGGKRVKSIVHDLAQEAMLGRQPTMPIPHDVVYVSTVTEWNASGSVASDSLEENDEEKRPPPRQLKEISNNEVCIPRITITEEKAAKDAESMPPPAKKGKSGTLRRAARTISEETSKASNPIKVATDEVVTIPRVPQIAPTTTSRLKEVNNSTSSAYQTARSEQALDPASEKPPRAGTMKRSADASLARRPRAPKAKAWPKSTEDLGALPTLDEMKSASPTKKLKTKSEPEVIEILSDPEPAPAPAAVPVLEKAVDPEKPSLPLQQPPKMNKRLPVPKKTTGDPNTVLGTDPNTVLDRLSQFRDNLEAALSNTCQTRSSPAEAENLPFVSRWVDYNQKHGMGWVMSDGKVGCLLHPRLRSKIPMTHCFIRQGYKWQCHVGKDLDKLSDVPMEVFEDCAEQGIKKKVYKGLGSVKQGPLKVEAERKRTFGLLWLKFGRYMYKTLEGEEEETASSNDNFVRFYQRVGNVGMWMFADGCLQIHFPDHTKIVLSALGTHISAICISPEAIAYLSKHSALLPHHTASRERFADSIASLLHDGGRVRSRIVKANALTEKLTFVLDVVKQWVKNGGLGRMDWDEELAAARAQDAAREEDEEEEDLSLQVPWNGLRWEGPAVKEMMRQGERFTVGRSGGDVR